MTKVFYKSKESLGQTRLLESISSYLETKPLSFTLKESFDARGTKGCLEVVVINKCPSFKHNLFTS